MRVIFLNTFEKIYEVVKRIPMGKVASYGQVAAAAGNPRWSQVVGYALHCNPSPGVIPCHRVVRRDGRVAESFAFGGSDVQRDLLMSEGVSFIDEKTVDMEKHMCREL